MGKKEKGEMLLKVLQDLNDGKKPVVDPILIKEISAMENTGTAKDKISEARIGSPWFKACTA
ncbi:MAG: hypothetical protein PHY72_02470 [Candidatus Pacebacteria bacterium]|nr:hypothetical protein [Candidatus Paceibacterota bacterium]